ncbi:sensor histidine kinase [Kordiimonas aquimaris]|uniref:sensor histidine kinase n=1 Tax=Kordiimonas aquimaris TaxID=707591 RepID=UPI0021CEB27A|nr:histidine kinase [Kordiimonas aquimaris]
MTEELTKPLGAEDIALHNKLEQQVGTNRGNLKNIDDGAASSTMTIVDRLFGTKEATFWSFQFFGWTGYGLVRTFQAIILENPLNYFSVFILAAIVIGVSMTIVMRHIYRIVRDKPLSLQLPVVVILCAAFGLLFSSLEVSLGPILIPGVQRQEGLGLFGNAMFEATALFAWSAIYFGYHYYTSLQEQKAEVLQATAMAHQAQLKMLRYQLNPHFLFNTLNAISTLVLEKSEEDANKMLTKLSSFLRYTLVNQPTQRIRLDQELYALGLYLDIEKVRFEDRLNIEYDIDEKTKAALVPSLILQPLIENAIKYAVAPAIDGGTLRVCAKLKGNDRLLLGLTDNGPGMPDINHIVSQSGSGVGIANTKERLAQIYHDDHKLSLENVEPTGLKITIEIPLERERAGTRPLRGE